MTKSLPFLSVVLTVEAHVESRRERLVTSKICTFSVQL